MLEQLALWYLRLNGYFTMPNFIAHGHRSSRTDVDVLGVRLPYSKEYPDDMKRLRIASDKIDVVFAESKTGLCRLNGPWRKGGDRTTLEYVVRRVGIFQFDDSCSDVARELYASQRYENAMCVVRIVCFGGLENSALPGVTQILWPDVLRFVSRRFRTYKLEKADHQHWDSFGRYLWEKLIEGEVPNVRDITDCWKARCPCWP